MKNLKYIFSALMLGIAVAACSDDDDLPGIGADTNFAGTFTQQDQMGRPGINTVFTTSESEENSFNRTIPARQIADFQPIFQSKVEALYTAYGATYENNILGLDAPTLTTALALDVLQVAPNAPTAYFTPTGTNPLMGVPLTGRTLQDDVIDVSLILLFGGSDGARFNGMNGTPNLVSDNVGLESGVASSSFPYLGSADF
ncbi:MAG: DUF4331 family protein [Nonlabens sp.]